MVNMTRVYTKGFDNLTEPTQFITTLNDNMDKVLGTTGIFTIWIILILLLVNNGYPLKQSFAAASYVSLILAWLFWILGLIGPKWLIFFLITAGIGIASMFFRPD